MKNKVNLKTDSNHKESTPGEIKGHEEQIVGLIGNLNNPSLGVVQNMAARAEISGNIINQIQSARKYGKVRVEQFIKKKLQFRLVSFYEVLSQRHWEKRNRERLYPS